MSQTKHARVIRAFALPVPAFNHLKNYQRHYQNQAIEAGTSDPVTNSEALGRILSDHAQLGRVAAFAGMQVNEFCTALALGDLIVTTPKAEGVGDASAI